MTENPLVTVNILSFNRKDELQNTLTKVFEQDYKYIEVVVVDNASTDGSADMVVKEFSEVKLIKLKKNIGIAGWNEGFKVAKGEYVLVLDDDAYPDKKSILISVEEMKKKPLTGAIAFNVYNILQNNKLSRFPGGWLPAENIETCRWTYFIGCAFLIRSSLFFSNLFSPSYFICFHEIPIIRYVIDRNYNIFYKKEIKAYHQNQSLNGLSPLKEYYHYRNLLNFVLWNLPFPFNLFYGIRIFLFFFTRSINRGWFSNYAKALLYQGKNLQGYKLRKLNKSERRIFFQTDFVEYRLSEKFKKV